VSDPSGSGNSPAVGTLSTSRLRAADSPHLRTSPVSSRRTSSRPLSEEEQAELHSLLLRLAGKDEPGCERWGSSRRRLSRSLTGVDRLQLFEPPHFRRRLLERLLLPAEQPGDLFRSEDVNDAARGRKIHPLSASLGSGGEGGGAGAAGPALRVWEFAGRRCTPGLGAPAPLDSPTDGEARARRRNEVLPGLYVPHRLRGWGFRLLGHHPRVPSTGCRGASSTQSWRESSADSTRPPRAPPPRPSLRS
jgi:hypothetical protein